MGEDPRHGKQAMFADNDVRYGITAVTRTAHSCKNAADELAKLNGLVHKLQLRESRANHNRENTEKRLAMFEEHQQKRERTAAELGEREEEYRQARESKVVRAREQREQVWEAGKKAAIVVAQDRKETAQRLRQFKDALDSEVHQHQAQKVQYYKEQRLNAKGVHKAKQEEDRVRRTKVASDMKEGRARTRRTLQDMHAEEDGKKRERVARQKDERHCEELTLEMRRQAREQKLRNLSQSNKSTADYINMSVLNPATAAIAQAKKAQVEAMQRMEEAARAEKQSADKLKARVRSVPQGNRFRISQKADIKISYTNV
jgi:hypothetical protein